MSAAEQLPSHLGDILDILPAAMVLIDAGGRITGWNHAAEVLYGHAGADALGASVVDLLFEPEDRDRAAALVSAAREQRPWSGDARVRRRDGALLVSSFQLVPTALRAGGGPVVAWIGTDGVDQGLAEQERSVLLSAEHVARATAEEALGMLEAVLGSAPVAIAVFDLDLRYLRVNDAYAQLSGKTPDEHIGGAFGDVMPPLPDVVADLRQVTGTGRSIVGRVVELDGPTGDPGQLRYFSVSYFPVRAAEGQLIGAGLSGVEITQLKRVESERLVLLRRAEEAQQRLAILAAASSVVASTLDLDELLARLASVLVPAVADWCAMVVYGRPHHRDHLVVWHEDRALVDTVVKGAGLAGATVPSLARALSSRPHRLAPATTIAEVLGLGRDDLPGADLPGAAGEALARRLEASVAVPVEANGEVLGILALATDAGRPLAEPDADLALDVAHRTALAVGNARAFEQERAIAETLQRALLPATVPAVPGLEVAVRYLPATERALVGGDWYDVAVLDAATTGIVIGDVVGHDVAASTAMGQLRSALRVVAHDDFREPGLTLSRVDRLMGPLGLSLATCIFGVFDRPSRTFTWSNAGHLPPAHVTATGVTLLTGGAGILLGVAAGEEVHQDRVTLAEGDLLVLYTDGLVERRRESLEISLARLAAAAAAVAGCSAEDACQRIVDTMLPGAARDDDVAILVARVS